jgi:uncharacterized RDD family membrane protein YckC
MTQQTEQNRISVGIRLATMLMDHLFMTVIAALFCIPGFISTFFHLFLNLTREPSRPLPPPAFMSGFPGYLAMFGFALYFCKDIFNGRSIAKRILNLQVVDNYTGRPASPLKCFVRNISCVLWPIEAIVAMVNTSRRLGDRLAGTKLVRFDPSLEQPGINIVRVIIPICISYGMMLALMQGIPQFKFKWPQTNYSETSYNPSESRGLEILLADSLGDYLTPSVKIYDTVNKENLKYLSVTLRLKENYMENENSLTKLKEETKTLIYSQFSKQSFTGQLTYIYRAPGLLESRTINIGTTPR